MSSILLHTGLEETNLQLAQEFFEANPSINYVHYHFVDMSGVLRVRVLSKTHSLKLVERHEPLRAGAFSLIGFAQRSELPPNFRPGGVNSLWPDWHSIRVLKPCHASVLCNVSEALAGHTDVNPEAPFLRCPRSTLQSLLAGIEWNMDFSLLAGFELEFFLMDEEDRKHARSGEEPPGYNNWSSAQAIRGSKGRCLEHCATALQAAGISVEQFHAESARHSYEISTGPFPVLAAVDTWVQSVEIVKQTAAEHGFQATFLPKPFSRLFCVGQHVHLSVDTARYTSGEEQKKSMRESFLAGILRRLPLLCGYGMPSEDSYKRVGLAFSACVAMEVQNRGVPVRKIDEGHWEFKTIDGTANLYLVLAAFVAAGALGVKGREQLGLQEITGEVCAKKGGDFEPIAPLPATLKDALKLCESDHMGLDALLGPQLLDFFTVIKKGEVRYFAALTDVERKKMYMDLF